MVEKKSKQMDPNWYHYPLMTYLTTIWGRSQTTFTNYVHKLRWQNFGFFWPPTPLSWHFLWYERWQKVDIFGPPTSCKRSLWTPPYIILAKVIFYYFSAKIGLQTAEKELKQNSSNVMVLFFILFYLFIFFIWDLQKNWQKVHKIQVSRSAQWVTIWSTVMKISELQLM